MHRIRRHPLFFGLVAIIVIAIAVEAWFVVVLRSQERVLERQLNQKITEIERLQRQRPGPTDENLRRAREDFRQHAETLATMLRSLNVSGPDELEYFKGEPASKTEAFFTIAQTIDNMRANWTSAGVLMRPDERFGFAAYTHEGPEPEFIRPVYRQFRIVDYLLSALLPARPRTLVSVQREDPRLIVQAQTKSQAQGNAAGAAPAAAQPPRTSPSFAGGGAAPGDSAAVSEIFVIDPQVSARTPGYVDTMAFRLTFTGQTSTLRGFMNALAVPEIPLVVRSVEVEPLSGERSGTAGRPASRTGEGADAAPDVAIVADNESRFIVTVELFEVKLRAPDPTGATP